MEFRLNHYLSDSCYFAFGVYRFKFSCVCNPVVVTEVSDVCCSLHTQMR
jgi:hypothetical protein